MISLIRFNRYRTISGRFFSTSSSRLSEYPKAVQANKKTAAAIRIPRSTSSRVMRPFKMIHKRKNMLSMVRLRGKFTTS